jgi:uncharacterized protein YneF (UPF0154 family)
MNLYIVVHIIRVIALFTGEDDFASPELIVGFFLVVMILHVGLKDNERKHLDKQFIKNMFLLKKNVFFYFV